MNRASGIVTIGLAFAMTGTVSAGDFRAYAPVLKTEPITETVTIPVQRTACTDPAESSREFRDVAPTIGEDIRNEIRLWEQHRSCRKITLSQSQERVIGYRVTYRYRGHTGTTRLSHDPGDHIPIDISLSPVD
jgi:uncharacterized protein YcfJ